FSSASEFFSGHPRGERVEWQIRRPEHRWPTWPVRPVRALDETGPGPTKTKAIVRLTYSMANGGRDGAGSNDRSGGGRGTGWDGAPRSVVGRSPGDGFGIGRLRHLCHLPRGL